MQEIKKQTHVDGWPLELLETLDLGILMLDKQYNILDWNRFIENHSRLDASEVLNHCVFDIFPEIDKEWFKGKCEPVFTVKTPMFILWEQRPYLVKFDSTRPITSSTTYMFQNVTIYPIKDVNDEVERLCVLIHDVTDQAIGKQQIQALNSELEKVSRTDGLTGLFNRRYWQERYEREYRLSIRNKNTPSSLMILDIDHFKKVNDTYGHQAGDEVIRVLADLITETMRTTDIIGRYGGEEFVVFLPNTDVNNAKIVAERLREKSERCPVVHEDTTISFTISIGLAEFSTDYANTMVWLEDADQALYSAKHNGRNQVCLAKA